MDLAHLSLRRQRIRELRTMLANRADELHPNFTSLVVRIAEVLNDSDATLDEAALLHGKTRELLK